MFNLLEGVRVIDFTTAAAGPSCTKLLAEYGAEVITVEPTFGATTRQDTYYYDFWNGNKKSCPLNVKEPAGKNAMLLLIKTADVFVSNFRIKALERLGLDYESLKKVNPGLIYGLLTGWGETRPVKDHPGYDVVCFWARGGYMRDMAEKGSICVSPQGVGDTATGQALGMAVSSALYRKARTGEGAKLSISIYGEGIYLNNFQSITSQFGEEFQKSRLAPREALANTYLCKDGWIVFFENKFRNFNNLLHAIGRDDLIGNPKWQCIDDTRFEHAPELVAIMDEAFSKMTCDEAVTALQDNGIAVEKCWSSLDTTTDPQALENKYYFNWTLQSGEKEGETIKMPASPVHVNDEAPVHGYKRGPRLGEHTLEVLKSAGLTDEEIMELAAKGITLAAE